MNDKIIRTLQTKQNFDPQDLSPHPKTEHNSGGGEPPMDNKYVTHEELNLTTEKILHQMDNRFNETDKKIDNGFANVDNKFENINTKFENINTKFENINTKFEKQKVWFLTTAITLTTAACTIIGFLIKFIK